MSEDFPMVLLPVFAVLGEDHNGEGNIRSGANHQATDRLAISSIGHFFFVIAVAFLGLRFNMRDRRLTVLHPEAQIIAP